MSLCAWYFKYAVVPDHDMHSATVESYLLICWAIEQVEVKYPGYCSGVTTHCFSRVFVFDLRFACSVPGDIARPPH